MVHFNELRISEDKEYLIIDASVDSDSCFDNIILDSIVIDNQSTYIDNGPSSNPLFSKKINTIYKEVYESSNQSRVYSNIEKYECYIIDTKNVRIKIRLNDYDIRPTDMIFVYILTSGTPDCEVNSSYILGTVVDLSIIYNKALCYLKETDCTCSIPKHFIDILLRFKAIELCIKTGNYNQAIKYWDIIISELNTK